MRVLHIITGLGQGGAEAAMRKLIAATMSRVEHTVVSLTDEGIHAAPLRAALVKVAALGMTRRPETFARLFALKRIVAEAAPTVIQTWMYHADLIGGLVARASVRAPVVWGVRHSNLERRRNRFTTLAIARICARLSNRVPAAIVFCSTQAARAHAAFGYCADRFRIIPNGYDMAEFDVDAGVCERVRRSWAAPEQILVGCVARWHPQKDHANLLEAWAKVRKTTRAIRCVLIGEGMTPENTELMALVRRYGLADELVLAGARTDIPAVMGAIDLHVLPSAGESFPNVLAEAMASGTPCVTTDVGDAAIIVGETGWVVPPGDPSALAAAIEGAVNALRVQGKAAFSTRCRQRIEAHYGIQQMADAYVDLWRGVALASRNAV